MSSWFVYVLECDGAYLYVGVTTDVRRRYREHLRGGARAAKYTRTRRRLELAYAVEAGDRSLAMQIEHRLRHLSAADKRRVLRERMSLPRLADFLGLHPHAAAGMLPA